MPRASWKGFLRLSLVSCPVYLSPATTRTKSIRLNQVWVPRARPAEPVEREENQEDVAPISRGRGGSQRSGRAGRRGGRGAGIRDTRHPYRAPAARSAYGRGDRPRRGAQGLRI